MYYGYGGDKPGTTHKKLGTTPRFFSRPRPPVRFYTVEALCRTHFPTMHAKYPPVLLRRTSRWMRAPWKQCCPNGPGGDAKSLWTARFIPQSPLSSRISPCSSPASLLLHRKILFAQNLGIVPTTDSFTHPLPMLHKADSPYFSSARSPERIHLLWHTWTSPVQNRDKNVGHHTPTSLYSALPCSFVAPRHKLPSF